MYKDKPGPCFRSSCWLTCCIELTISYQIWTNLLITSCMKLLGSSSTHQRSIINTTFTVPNGFAPFFEWCSHCSCIFRGSPFCSFPLHTWLVTNGKERKYDLYLLCAMTCTVCPFHKSWGTGGVRQSDEGSFQAQRLLLLSSDGTWSTVQNQSCATSLLWQTSYLLRETC